MTLTQAAIWTKRGVIGFIIFIILSIAGSIGYSAWYQYQLAHRPPVEEKPDMKFGALPALVFPPQKVSSSNYSYTLDTVTGGLPQMPKLMKVYFMPPSAVTLMAPEKARQMATGLGFTNGPQVISPSVNKYTDDNNGEFNIDLTTGNFNFQRLPASASAEINSINVDQSKLAQDFKGYLGSKGLLNESLSPGRTVVVNSTVSIPNSSAFDVSLWPGDLDNIPIVTAYTNYGLIKTTITNASKETDKFISLQYTFWPIDKTTFSTYPLKTPDQAFTELQGGGGFVSLEPSNPQISVTSVEMAYYESENYSPYLQPVFLFKGPNFAAIVPAIKTN
ncbi:MAG: hypothetical protein M1142_01905 [Patescibacteria group bacterium]|nr:hypothetical protein [Patescibacteria group bacterium]